LAAQIPSNKILNYIGISISLFSILFYVFVKTQPKKTADKGTEIQLTHVHVDNRDIDKQTTTANKHKTKTDAKDIFDRFSPQTRRIVGFVLIVAVGLLYGSAFIPMIYMGQQNKNANYLDYLLAYYSGIFMTTFVFLIINSALMKNRPTVYPTLMLPGLVSGLAWALGDICYFLAAGALSQAISFPISAIGPPVVSGLWSVILYKEVKGVRNLGFLISGIFLAFVASILIGLSF
jgi:hypothetical protein